MGECGCDIEIRRCKAHAGDVILVLEPEEADALKRKLRGEGRMGDRHLLAHIDRDLRRGGVPSAGGGVS